MSVEQISDLNRIYGEIEIEKISRTIKPDQIDNTAPEQLSTVGYDVLAIVAPPDLQMAFLKAANGRPVIFSESERIIIKNADGTEDKVVFKFKCWRQLKKFEIVTEVL
jgi:hypothetical protein